MFLFRKILFISALASLLISLWGCGGNAGSTDSPQGAGAGVPSELRLTADRLSQKAGKPVSLTAKLLDGNGQALPGQTISFTVKSGPGFLSAGSALTDGTGRAYVTLSSSFAGLVLVSASSGTSGWVTAGEAVAFTSDTVSPNVLTLTSNKGCVLDTTTNTVKLTALLRTAKGQAVAGRRIDFYTREFADDPSKVAFYDDAGTLTNSAVTNSKGSATINMRMNFNTGQYFINIYAVDSLTGASDVLTLSSDRISEIKFVNLPRAITNSTSFKAEVEVFTDRGGQEVPVNDGTPVEFDIPETTYRTTTTGGHASIALTAPETLGPVFITVSAGCISATGVVTVTEPLSVTPSKVELFAFDNPDPYTTDNIKFFIKGGVGPYTVTTSRPGVIDPPLVSWDFYAISATFEVDPDPKEGVDSVVVILTITDSIGESATVEVTVKEMAAAVALSVSPSAVAIEGINNPDGGNTADNFTFLILGGTGPYTVTSSHPSIIANPGALGSGVSTFTIDPDDVAVTTIVTLTVMDSTGATDTATVTVIPPSLSIVPPSIIRDDDPFVGLMASFNIFGGAPPYTVTSSHPDIAYDTGAGDGTWSVAASGDAFTVNVIPDAILGSGSTTSLIVTFTVVDSAGQWTTATLTINDD